MQRTDAGPGDADGLDLPACWAVPLDEQDATSRPTDSAHEAPGQEASVILTFVFHEATSPPEAGFHPRLRRFDEAA